MQPTAYFLIGVPAAGKSTWTKQYLTKLNCVLISSDEHVEQHARSLGLTYSDVFNEYVGTATAQMNSDVVHAVQQGRSVVWDQTNLTKAGRVSKMQKLPGYKYVAVVFPTPDPDEHRRRLDGRVGKAIPDNIIRGMITGYEEPTLSEGFCAIVLASHFTPPGG